MRGRRISLSRPRRFLVDLLHFAAQVPTVPVQRRMALAEVAAARNRIADRPCWPALFLKAYSRVADELPPLRRAYVGLPWPHLREYPKSIGSVAVEREYQNEPCVFFARIADPASLPLDEIHARIRHFAEAPVETVTTFRKMLSFARWPRPVRRAFLWLGLNLPRIRPGQFGTFGLSVYSSLGAESLHPLSPLTTTLNYGVIDRDGTVWVRLIYDHRVFDGATAARALDKLETVLTGPILGELRGMTPASRAAA
ncbi:MAG: 2-oxo acid dehydrogenase subunit E2 [Gemmataceae bacterium]|nr:2-oxo acid dehydrogenase subunit E2 [Gemmataceae bacterium]